MPTILFLEREYIMAIKSTHQDMLALVFAKPLEGNKRLTELRQSILSRTSPKADRLAVIRNESDDPDIREAVSLSETLAKQIEDLKAQRAEIEDAITNACEVILAKNPEDSSLEEDRKRFIDSRKSFVAEYAAARTVAANIVGSTDIVDEYLESVGFEEVATLRGSSTRSGSASGIKRPRFNSLTVVSNGETTNLDKPTLSSAAAYLSKKFGIKVTAGDLNNAYHGETTLTDIDSEVTWEFAIPGIGGSKPSIVILTATPRVNSNEDDAVEEDDDENEN